MKVKVIKNGQISVEMTNLSEDDLAALFYALKVDSEKSHCSCQLFSLLDKAAKEEFAKKE